ncbi:MAG: hypothetical protein J5874_01210 [Oscillospiraceae bacterium]|nr:hypothetical protein [Oscillospiraceae bacterium]
MKKTIVFVMLAAITITTLFGCGKTDRLDSDTKEAVYPQDLKQEESSETEYTVIHTDWPMYNTVNEIINASTNIYSGTVTDISFEIIDYKTGKIDNDPNSTSTSRTIYTVYSVDINNSCTGNNPKTVKIRKIGGIAGFKEKEQRDLLVSSGLILSDVGKIIINDDDCSLKTGKEYLFCTVRSDSVFDLIINPYQFAHDIDSANAKNIIDALK